jgi:hypothetical protein
MAPKLPVTLPLTVHSRSSKTSFPEPDHGKRQQHADTPWIVVKRKEALLLKVYRVWGRM